MEGTTNHTCDINSKNKTADPVALVNKTGFIYFQPYEVSALRNPQFFFAFNSTNGKSRKILWRKVHSLQFCTQVKVALRVVLSHNLSFTYGKKKTLNSDYTHTRHSTSRVYLG